MLAPTHSPMPFLLVDKPAGITSHDVVDRVRRITGERTVGHAGTLDPFATGLLVVGVGRDCTKRLGEFLGQDKSYEATMVLGASSDTQDGTGVLTPTSAPLPSQEELTSIMKDFVGPQLQTPPMYSAKKIGGKKLYELARAGEEIARPPVPVTIHELTLLSFDSPCANFSTRCSSGTYVRTIAHDIGAKLGCGAYLETLRRTAIGTIAVAKATALADLTKENWTTHATSL
jgi:tRNA pseudouridine55 synthase